MKTIRFLRKHAFPDGETYEQGVKITTDSDEEAAALIKDGAAEEVVAKKASRKVVVDDAPSDSKANGKVPDDTVAAQTKSAGGQTDAESANLWNQISTQLVDRAVDAAFKRARRTGEIQRPGMQIEVGEPNDADFETFGDFCAGVYYMGKHQANQGAIPQEYKNKVAKAISRRDEIVEKAPAGSSTLYDTDLGLFLPTKQVEELLTKAYTTGQVMSRVRSFPWPTKTFRIPYINETSRATGSRFGGITVYWMKEAGTYTGSRPKAGELVRDLEKLGAMWDVTDELEMDAIPAYMNIVLDAFAQEFRFTLENAIFRGNGVGQPLGILSAPCLRTVAAHAGSPAGSIDFLNLTEMLDDVWIGSRSSLVAYYNPNMLSDLYQLTVPGTTTAAFAPGTLSAAGGVPGLFGIPWIPCEYCAAPGSPGDVLFADMSQYLLPMHSSGLRQDVSIHFRFDTGEQTFRWQMRVNGAPWWSSTLTGFQSGTFSPFVVCATR